MTRIKDYGTLPAGFLHSHQLKGQQQQHRQKSSRNRAASKMVPPVSGRLLAADANTLCSGTQDAFVDVINVS